MNYDIVRVIFWYAQIKISLLTWIIPILEYFVLHIFWFIQMSITVFKTISTRIVPRSAHLTAGGIRLFTKTQVVRDWNLINEIRTYSAWTLSLCLCFFYSSNTGKHKNIKENFELHIMKYILEPILYAVWPKETRVWRTTLEQSFIKVQKS